MSLSWSFLSLHYFIPCRQSDSINLNIDCEQRLWENVSSVRVCLCAVLLSFCMVVYMMVCTECEEWPKEKRSEIMFSFFVSDLHSRKLQQRLNEKLWLVENYFRSHGSWRSNGPFHISQCSQNPSKSIDIELNLTTSIPPLPHHPHITTMSCPLLPLEATWDKSVHAAPQAVRLKLPSCVWHLGSATVSKQHFL